MNYISTLKWITCESLLAITNDEEYENCFKIFLEREKLLVKEKFNQLNSLPDILSKALENIAGIEKKCFIGS